MRDSVFFSKPYFFTLCAFVVLIASTASTAQAQLRTGRGTRVLYRDAEQFRDGTKGPVSADVVSASYEESILDEGTSPVQHA